MRQRDHVCVCVECENSAIGGIRKTRTLATLMTPARQSARSFASSVLMTSHATLVQRSKNETH